MHFNLGNLVEHHDLQQLDQQIIHEEIDEIVKHLPSDKAPALTGSMGFFSKNAGPSSNRTSINFAWNSFIIQEIFSPSIMSITLVRKVNNPSSVNDFRPISLINYISKIITKVMGNRSQKVTIPLIHKNQYEFIKTRTIQDCLTWAFEYIHQCHYSKRQIIILKLDFTKAFDTVEHTPIIQMMKHIGFSNNWLDWTQKILGTACTKILLKILLNRVLGKNIHCKSGVRQGDPFSSLLFVLATDLLRCIINKAHAQALFQLPISSRDGYGYPIIQYTDDTILIMKASQRELLCLKAILETFAQVTGLRVNHGKYCLVPLNMDAEQASLLAGVFGCKLQDMSFTYLGLSMGTTKHRVEPFAPLMNRVERQLTVISSMITQAGKLQLVNSILSSLPTYNMCSVTVPIAILEGVDRARKHCMWQNSDCNAMSKPLVAWRKCTRQRKK
jgi:hypothetical protein